MTNPVLTTTALDIIRGALQEIGEVDANQSVPADQFNDGLRDLNYMLKSWQSQGLHLWTKTEGILFLDVGKSDYKLGPSGDECGNADDFVNTEVAVPVSVGFPNITMDSTTGMAGATDILTSDPSESTQGWTVVAGTLAIVATSLEVRNAGAAAGEVERTFSGLVAGREYQATSVFLKGASPSVTYSVKEGATTLATETLTVSGTSRVKFTATQTSHTFEVLNGDTAGTNETTTTSIKLLDTTTGDFFGLRLDDNTRQWTKIIEVLGPSSVSIVDIATGAAAVDNSVFTFPDLIDRPLRILQLRRQKVGNTAEIEANQWSRQEYFAQTNKSSQGEINNWYYNPQLIDGRVYVWQTANDVDQIARFTYERPIDISENNAEAPDFPSEWFLVIKINLAAVIASQYRVPATRRQDIEFRASQLLDNALGYDLEPDSLNIQPEF